MRVVIFRTQFIQKNAQIYIEYYQNNQNANNFSKKKTQSSFAKYVENTKITINFLFLIFC